MNSFKYKEPYKEDDLLVLEINILPEKYCNFDCIFCPIGRSNNHTDEIKEFENVEECIKELENKLDAISPDLVFINSAGEALVHSAIDRVINLIKSKNIQVRLLSNGYILNDDKYKSIAQKCDEVIGEIKTINEMDFQKLQRPKKGYTLENHISNMVIFNNDYNGKFILEITIIKDKSDSKYAVKQLKKMVELINPDELIIVTMDGIFEKKLGITPEKLTEIRELLF